MGRYLIPRLAERRRFGPHKAVNRLSRIPRKHFSPEIARLYLDLIEMKIGIDDVARSRPFWQSTRVGRRRPMMELVSSSMRKRKADIAFTNACKRVG